MTTKEYYQKRDLLNSYLNRVIALNKKVRGFCNPKTNKISNLFRSLNDRLNSLEKEQMV